ncbi:MAG: DUF4442 domain-containing protein [Bacteroidia bacterium]
MSPAKAKRLIKLLNFWPPFIGAGIRVKSVNDDLTRFEVQMKLRFYNKNMFGTHYGGSLYAMCDPFFVFIVMYYMGDGYVVWDKTATIHFRKPGKGRMRAIFEIGQDELARIKQEVDATGKKTFWFTAEVIGPEGELVAEVEKEVYVRKGK